MNEAVNDLIKEHREQKRAKRWERINRNPAIVDALVNSGYLMCRMQEQTKQLAALNRKMEGLRNQNEFLKRSQRIGDYSVAVRIDWRMLLHALEKLSARGQGADFTRTDVDVLRRTADKIEKKIEEAGEAILVLQSSVPPAAPLNAPASESEPGGGR